MNTIFTSPKPGKTRSGNSAALKTAVPGLLILLLCPLMPGFLQLIPAGVSVFIITISLLNREKSAEKAVPVPVYSNNHKFNGKF